MTTVSEQCQYTYDPPEPVRSDGDIDIPRPTQIQCPHEAIDVDSQRCLFHSDTTEYPPDQFTEQFLDALNDDTVPSTFAGGRLNGLDLKEETVTTASGRPIDLRGTVIDGDLDLSEATIEVPLLLDRAAITGDFYADDAVFDAPVSLAEADISGGIHWHNATVAGGIVADGLNGGYVDGRDITISGPLLLSGAEFASNVLLARGKVAESVDMRETVFDYSLDATLLTVAGDISLSKGSIGGDCDLIGAAITGDANIQTLSVTGELDWSHATIDGDVLGSESVLNGVAIFDDVTVRGSAIRFNNAEFDGKADFATMTAAVDQLSYSDTTFAGEVWFTHAQIDGNADFTGATFSGMTHLRDAVWDGDLCLAGVRSTGQFFLHGSTIAGAIDCTDSTFEHFQFSATVEQGAEFVRAEFVEKAIFRSSTFGGRVRFDEALFSGHPDFTDTRFTGEATFEGTEFLVDPTFEDTRFAVAPELNAAEFPIDAMAIAERRKQMILAHPESLSHSGATLPESVLSGDVPVPADVASLLDSDVETTRRVAAALTEYDRRTWHELVEDAIRTARTAVVELEAEDSDTMLVFSVTLNDNATSLDEVIKSITTAGVYCHTDSEIRFGHLDPVEATADYLITIPASDAAFESGAAVATTSELQAAAIRNEKLRAALLSKQATTIPMQQHIRPILAGSLQFE